MSTHCWSVVAPRSGPDALWTPTAHPRAQRCLLSPLLGRPQPRHAPPETDPPPLPPCCTVLGLFRLVRGQDLGQGTWPRAAFLVSGVLVTQSKCLSLDTRAALCRALGCEPRVPTGLQALLSGHRAGPGSPSVHRECRGLITTYFTPTGKLLAVLMVQEALCVTTQPWAVIVKLSA